MKKSQLYAINYEKTKRNNKQALEVISMINDYANYASGTNFPVKETIIFYRNNLNIKKGSYVVLLNAIKRVYPDVLTNALIWSDMK